MADAHPERAEAASSIRARRMARGLIMLVLAGAATIAGVASLRAGEPSRDTSESSGATTTSATKASNGCDAATEQIREVMDEFDSGLVVDESGSRTLTDGLADLDAAVSSGSCDARSAEQFRSSVLGPWLNATPGA